MQLVGRQSMPNCTQIGEFTGSFFSVHRWMSFYLPTLFRLEMHTESGSNKPDLIIMDQIEEVSADYVQYKNENCIQIKLKDNIRDPRVILTNQVCRKLNFPLRTLLDLF